MSDPEDHLLDAEDAIYTITGKKEIIIHPKKGKVILDEWQTDFFSKVRQILKD